MSGAPGGKPPFATGGMSPEGVTTVVTITKPKLDYEDKKVLCSAMCECYKQPNIGSDGRRLKQECVALRLKTSDAEKAYRSHYKAEYTYDMTKHPPEPFLDKTIPTKSYTLFPTWTSKLWPKDPTRPQPYVPGEGYTRRPDVVIVKDPTLPPIQSNIKQVVEMKFPDDVYGPRQREDYVIIAGGETKMVPLELEDCDCEKREPEQAKVPVSQMTTAAAILSVILSILARRPVRAY